MDLHVYRNSQDRWHDLRAVARSQGSVLAVGAVTLDELVRRLTPGVREATLGQQLALVSTAVGESVPVRYAFEALSELKGARVSPAQLRKAGDPALAEYLENYDRLLQSFGLMDSQDRRWRAAANVRESEWLQRFESVILHALYDPNPAEFAILHNVVERLPGGGTVVLFNATANVRPTQFAEWTWQRFVHDEALSDKAFPEFVRSAGPVKGTAGASFCVRCESIPGTFEGRLRLPALFSVPAVTQKSKPSAPRLRICWMPERTLAKSPLLSVTSTLMEK